MKSITPESNLLSQVHGYISCLYNIPISWYRESIISKTTDFALHRTVRLSFDRFLRNKIPSYTFTIAIAMYLYFCVIKLIELALRIFLRLYKATFRREFTSHFLTIHHKEQIKNLNMTYMNNKISDFLHDVMSMLAHMWWWAEWEEGYAKSFHLHLWIDSMKQFAN